MVNEEEDVGLLMLNEEEAEGLVIVNEGGMVVLGVTLPWIYSTECQTPAWLYIRCESNRSNISYLSNATPQLPE